MLMRSNGAAGGDEDLLHRAHTGDPRAVEHLLARYRPLVESRAHAYFLLGADHEDVVQEGMIGLYKAIRDFKRRRATRFKIFAELCVTRQIITAVKSATRQKHVPLNTYVSFQQPAPGAGLVSECLLVDYLPDIQNRNPELTMLQQRAMETRLEELHTLLSPLERYVLDAYLDGKSYRDMSQDIKRTFKAIDNALQRVKRKIAALSDEA